jgi:hypothetical protein
MKIIVIGNNPAIKYFNHIQDKTILVVGEPSPELLSAVQIEHPDCEFVDLSKRPLSEVVPLVPPLPLLIPPVIEEPYLFEEKDNYINGKKKLPRRRRKK